MPQGFWFSVLCFISFVASFDVINLNQQYKMINALYIYIDAITIREASVDTSLCLLCLLLINITCSFGGVSSVNCTGAGVSIVIHFESLKLLCKFHIIIIFTVVVYYCSSIRRHQPLFIVITIN